MNIMRNYKIRHFLHIVIILAAGHMWPVSSQSGELIPLTPNIIDMKAIIQQHYSKRQFSVLSDTLGSAVFAHKRYVVVGDAVIPHGVKLAIPPDVTVFFEPKASLQVNGSLHAVGTVDVPIIFSKIDSSDMVKKPNSNDFKWNGISVSKDGAVVLKNVRIEHSQNGVFSDGLCDSLVLESVHFSKSAPLTLYTNNSSILVNDTAPFTLLCPSPVEQVRNHTPKFVYWMYGLGAACAITSGAFGLTAYRTDKEAARATDHFIAQPLADKATRHYRASLWTGAASVGFIIPAIVVQLSGPKRKGTR